MTKGCSVLIWICCLTNLCVGAKEIVTIQVLLGPNSSQKSYEIAFGEAQLVSFHDCLCNSHNQLCKTNVSSAGIDDGGKLVTANTTGKSYDNGMFPTNYIVCTVIYKGQWHIDCGRRNSTESSGSRYHQYLTLETVGNSCNSECLQVRWNSSQTLTFQNQTKFNVRLTHSQCPVAKENHTNIFIIVGVGMGGLVLVVLVLVVVLIVVRRRRGSGNVRNSNVPFNDAPVAVGEKEEHYSEVQGDSLSSPSTLHDTSEGALFNYQNVDQDNSSVAYDTEFYHNSHAQLQEPNESTVYSETSRSSPPGLSPTENCKTYAKLHEVRRDVVNVYGSLEEME